MKEQVTFGISLPPFVNLKVYDFGFKVTIALHISEAASHKFSIYYSDDNTKVGKDSLGRYIVIRERFYSDRCTLKDLITATHTVACQDKRDLMIILRQCKCMVLDDEIDTLELQ